MVCASVGAARQAVKQKDTCILCYGEDVFADRVKVKKSCLFVVQLYIDDRMAEQNSKF